LKQWICGRCYTLLVGHAPGACTACGAKDVVPVTTPRGRQVVAQAFSVPAQPPVVDTRVCAAISIATQGNPVPVMGVLPPAGRGRPPDATASPGLLVCTICYEAGPGRRPDIGAATFLGVIGFVVVVLGIFYSWILIGVGMFMLLSASLIHAAARPICTRCGARNLVPAASARGQALVAGPGGFSGDGTPTARP